MKPQGHIPPSAPPGAHEGAGLHLGAIRGVALVIGVTLVFLIGLLTVIFGTFDRTYPNRTSEAAPRVTPEELPPTPRLQIDPARDLAEVRAAEDLHLKRYGWIDRPQGLAQIPIDRAMILWAQSYSAMPATNAPPVTELQMRQQKAQGGTHAP
jgi:hypothetical protein